MEEINKESEEVSKPEEEVINPKKKTDYPGRTASKTSIIRRIQRPDHCFHAFGK